jgi:hypothetical protein
MPTSQKQGRELLLKLSVNKSDRQDRRRPDKYDVIKEKTNKVSTAIPRNITIIGSLPNA